VARRELLLLALAAPAPDRSDGVEHVPRPQTTGTCCLGVARPATAELSALPQDRRAAGAVDGAVDAAAAEQRRIGGVHDRMHILLGDVADDELDHDVAGAVRRNAGRLRAREGPGSGTRPRL
jgi:hypothetical protein